MSKKVFSPRTDTNEQKARVTVHQTAQGTVINIPDLSPSDIGMFDGQTTTVGKVIENIAAAPWALKDAVKKG